MKSMGELTLYDLMAEDLDVWVSKDKGFGFRVEIDDEDGCELMREEGVHPFAAESFAIFCRQYLRAYESASSVDGGATDGVVHV